jgi:glycerate kinase
MRPVLVAPDSFKGTFGAADVAAAIAAGLGRAGLEAQASPLADGGEGTLDVVGVAVGAELRDARAEGPLGDAVNARFALWDGGRSALVESAQAAGLGLVAADRSDPERATTRGVGELIVRAVAAGASEILVGVGGTASTDGGRGAVDVVEAGGGLGGAKLTVLCDVRTPFEEAARVFGPQKGADAAAVERLGGRLASLAEEYPRDPRGVQGGGAGGGLAGGLWAALGADLVPGAERVADLVGLDAGLRKARSVVVGEGRLDAQTSEGKVIAEVCRRARPLGLRVDAIVGSSELSEGEVAGLGLTTVRKASSLDALEGAAESLGRELGR